MDGEMRQLRTAFLVTLLVLVIQLIGWYYSNSLALLGDTAHVFSDMLCLGVSIAAVWLALRAPSSRYTFGLHRAEVFSAFFNGMLLVLMSLLIAYEALLRVGTGYVINSLPMLVTSIIGLAGNVYVAYALQHEENLNVRSVFLHAAGDALSSVGVILAAVLILFTGQYLIDIAVSLLISGIILFNAYNVLRNSLSILLESAPHGADTDRISSAVRSIKGVRGVHDIHVWRTCSELCLAMMHVETDNISVSEASRLSRKIEEKLRDDFGICHTTIQVEPCGESCESRGACKVRKHRNR
jgi:cobalt-zinc-cadmium efflux system protein